MPKFTPSKPFRLYRGDGVVNKDSAFLSGIVEENIRLGGPTVYVWLMEGTFDQRDERGDVPSLHTFMGQIDPDTGVGKGIQDAILGENRDRKYSDDAYRLDGIYQVSQNAVDFASLGMMLTTDVIQMSFHTEAMERIIGRKVAPGDVVEMPHLRDVDTQGRPKNRWYEVKSIIRSPTGFDPGWKSHVTVATMFPMRAQQEFTDLLERRDDSGRTLEEQISSRAQAEEITARIQDEAARQSPVNFWDDSFLWIDPTTDRIYKFTDDAKPPNGLPVTNVQEFPEDPVEGDWVLRVDHDPMRLFRYDGTRWRLKEIDRKREWGTYNWTDELRRFATDRSPEDSARPWQFVSLRDVLTARETTSDPSPATPAED